MFFMMVTILKEFFIFPLHLKYGTGNEVGKVSILSCCFAMAIYSIAFLHDTIAHCNIIYTVIRIMRTMGPFLPRVVCRFAKCQIKVKAALEITRP